MKTGISRSLRIQHSQRLNYCELKNQSSHACTRSGTFQGSQWARFLSRSSSGYARRRLTKFVVKYLACREVAFNCVLEYLHLSQCFFFLRSLLREHCSATGADVEHVRLFLGVVGGTDHRAGLAGTKADA